MDTFEGENMETHSCVLGYRIDLYFCNYKLAAEVDEKGHKDRSDEYETQRQEAIDTELDCKFIRINPDEENFNIFKARNKIFRHIKEENKKLTKNKLINDAEKLTNVFSLL